MSMASAIEAAPSRTTTTRSEAGVFMMEVVIIELS